MSMIQCLVAAKTAYEIQKLQEIAVNAAAAQAAFFIAMMQPINYLNKKESDDQEN